MTLRQIPCSLRFGVHVHRRLKWLHHGACRGLFKLKERGADIRRSSPVDPGHSVSKFGQGS